MVIRTEPSLSRVEQRHASLSRVEQWHVSEALIEAKLGLVYRSIFEATTGIVFLATPHRGSSAAANLGAVAAGIARYTMVVSFNVRLIRRLESRNNYLVVKSHHFSEIYSRFNIYTIYKMVRIGRIMPWRVPKDSAVMNLPNETHIPLNGGHRSVAQMADPGRGGSQIFYRAVCELVTQTVPVRGKLMFVSRPQANRSSRLYVFPRASRWYRPSTVVGMQRPNKTVQAPWYTDGITPTQDYLYVHGGRAPAPPGQRWLDGVAVAPRVVRQFVAGCTTHPSRSRHSTRSSASKPPRTWPSPPDTRMHPRERTLRDKLDWASAANRKQRTVELQVWPAMDHQVAGFVVFVRPRDDDTRQRQHPPRRPAAVPPPPLSRYSPLADDMDAVPPSQDVGAGARIRHHIVPYDGDAQSWNVDGAVLVNVHVARANRFARAAGLALPQPVLFAAADEDAILDRVRGVGGVGEMMARAGLGVWACEDPAVFWCRERLCYWQGYDGSYRRKGRSPAGVLWLEWVNWASYQ
ncbi:hypothetical protein B0T26DRAFT_672189 [Lasiosphaeria miniovina]|uniref:Uncharacterized protein n=1 Tax=Lasiosphaeria miniovina TaxID=1954250 RepID=A0AA40E565_9PEZI|nr:uncharacterized protein B0T26DRAFT_672189 [Lasiosphaeria miniovina]KAK0727535.1 hypothetical protein B0T26DRAFT_672189 [Lasiosphaeria miniovina]